MAVMAVVTNGLAFYLVEPQTVVKRAVTVACASAAAILTTEVAIRAAQKAQQKAMGNALRSFGDQLMNFANMCRAAKAAAHPPRERDGRQRKLEAQRALRATHK
jgi:hypothetical protein